MAKKKEKLVDSGQLLWVRKGDHVTKAEHLCQKNEKENGRLSGSPTVMLREFPSGTFTVLSADPEWWRDEMRLHIDWDEPLDSSDDFLAYIGERGTRRP